MYVVEVIPLTVLPPNVPQILSYFCDVELPKGAIVQIPLNNRKITAAIISSSSLENQKMFLKKTLFQLKKVSSVISEKPVIDDFQFRIALWISRMYFTSLGVSLNTVLPPFFLKKKYPTSFVKQKFNRITKKPLIIRSSAKNTDDSLKPHIETALKNKQQVLLVVPDTASIPYFENKLSNLTQTAIITSKTNNADYHKVWVGVSEGKLSLIIGTRQSLFLPFNNLGVIIVDDPNHEFYKSDMSPKYNTPDLAKEVANLRGSKLIFNTPALSIDELYCIKNNDCEFFDNSSRFSHNYKLVDMAMEIKSGNFSILSRELLEKINKFLKLKKKILLFSSRRGYLGIFLCQNCGWSAKCPQCGTLLRIHKTTEPVLVCHRCNFRQPLIQQCPNCSSHSLKPVGPAGSQKIFETIRKMMEYGQLPKTTTLILDSDVTKNNLEEKEVMDESDSNQGSIIIATQMVLSYRYTHGFDLVGILSFDSLASGTDFRTEERLKLNIQKIFDFMPEETIIQTFNTEQTHQLLDPSYEDIFYNREIKIREQLSYPPFWRIIRLSFKHKDQQKALFNARTVSEKLKRVAIQMGWQEKIKINNIFALSATQERGPFEYGILIRTAADFDSLREFLKFVPSSWMIDVDPRTIL